MSTTSQKHRDFVGEPMGDKPVTALSGIGEVLGKNLEHKGFDKVSSDLLLGLDQYCAELDLSQVGKYDASRNCKASPGREAALEPSQVNRKASANPFWVQMRTVAQLWVL